ncbi:iron complex transport system substrate-binding protein [Altererythrobacter atlanticus]|uniref:Corrinoid ABC transporter substrate-binding protein n=1 Tax=Croceibacterium atlanticum TaxID=1267766 RepID=A0A0F7KX88_9SPHN|nr:ABC transporter substrate-binding protein [Croceibacterium atlanticum]AKH43847.1 corrinoid ABC transporter substrate-binding protein [Croceibacterium atlanticum]MBB5733703.1 iron complex transport system substrate-binding protein [Croceibacterium atlanticum]
MLVPPDRIASVTYLAHDAVEVLMPGADRGLRTNRGTAEDLVRDRPDLILTNPWAAQQMNRLAEKVGAPMVEIGSASNFEDIRRITRQAGAAVGEPERAEELIAAMDRDLAELGATSPAEPMRVVAWNGDGSVPGKGTLTDAIIRAAGAENVAATMPDSRFSTYGMEELLLARPDAILRGNSTYDQPSLRETANEHPLIRKAFAGRQIAYPASLYGCGLPISTKAAQQLRDALETVPEGPVRW